VIKNFITYRFNVSWQVRSLWFLLIFCLNSFLLSAQNYPTRHFTMRDGLPSMAIRYIYKDTRGLLWIETDAGLCSFDGKSFRIYKTSEGMKANMVWAINEDEQGNMWFGSYGDGLYKYDGQHFKRFTQKDGLASDFIRVLCYYRNFHCLVAGSEGGVSTIRGKTITSSPAEMFSDLNGKTVTGLADVGKFIYITTYGPKNPIRYYPDKNKFVSVNDKGAHYPDYSFSCYFSSKGDTLFTQINKGIRIFSRKGIIENDTLGQIFGITEDKRGDL
jgi:hypothetical protein